MGNVDHAVDFLKDRIAIQSRIDTERLAADRDIESASIHTDVAVSIAQKGIDPYIPMLVVAEDYRQAARHTRKAEELEQQLAKEPFWSGLINALRK